MSGKVYKRIQKSNLRGKWQTTPLARWGICCEKFKRVLQSRGRLSRLPLVAARLKWVAPEWSLPETRAGLSACAHACQTLDSKAILQLLTHLSPHAASSPQIYFVLTGAWESGIWTASTCIRLDHCSSGGRNPLVSVFFLPAVTS